MGFSILISDPHWVPSKRFNEIIKKYGYDNQDAVFGDHLKFFKANTNSARLLAALKEGGAIGHFIQVPMPGSTRDYYYSFSECDLDKLDSVLERHKKHQNEKPKQEKPKKSQSSARDKDNNPLSSHINLGAQKQKRALNQEETMKLLINQSKSKKRVLDSPDGPNEGNNSNNGNSNSNNSTTPNSGINSSSGNNLSNNTHTDNNASHTEKKHRLDSAENDDAFQTNELFINMSDVDDNNVNNNSGNNNNSNVNANDGFWDGLMFEDIINLDALYENSNPSATAKLTTGYSPNHPYAGGAAVTQKKESDQSNSVTISNSL